VDQHFPGVDPIGRELHLGYGDHTRTWTIVGVVGDVRQRALAGDPMPGYYLPLTQVGWSSMRAVLRTRGEPMALLEPVRRELAGLDPLIAIRQAETLADRFSQAAGPPRFNAILVSGFALVALGLALAGIFSVMSFMVSQHTREIGLRMALGERPGQVRWATSRRGLQMAAAGIVLGLGASLALTRGLEGMLYGVERVDAPTLAGGAALFVLVAVAGSYWPARRASAVDPAVALRGE
jgi:putative ABC transport system permease protein